MYNQEEKARLLKELQSSGLTVSEFSREKSLGHPQICSVALVCNTRSALVEVQDYKNTEFGEIVAAIKL